MAVKGRRWLWIPVAVLLVAVAVMLLPGERLDARVFLDGEAIGGTKSIRPGTDDLRVYITLNGRQLLDLPFEEAHTVRIVQPDGGENAVVLTGASVCMTEANCEGQDCVQMGEITRENLEVRVMGGFIICLPHRISVEVR